MVEFKIKENQGQMERLFAPNGPFVEKNDYCTDLLYVDFRDPKDINLGLNELEAKYPKEGRRKSSNLCEQLDVELGNKVR